MLTGVFLVLSSLNSFLLTAGCRKGLNAKQAEYAVRNMSPIVQLALKLL